MPIYEYVCTGCGRRIDVIHGIHASRPSTCEVCGSPLRKALSAPAIVFRGSGWAKKDARDRLAGSKAGAASDGESGGGKTGESGGDGGKAESPTGDAPAKAAPEKSDGSKRTPPAAPAKDSKRSGSARGDDG